MQNKITIVCVILALTFWFVDAFVSSLLSEDNISFLDSSFHPDGATIWMRSFVILLLLIFSAYSQHLIRIINSITQELEKYKEDLEYKIAELNMEATERKYAIEELEQLAITDPLTSVYNRRKFNEILNYEVERNQRYQTGLSLVMCDIDHFKKINDQFGHDTGDEVLKTFSEKVMKNIREVDIFARWGGEEFMILMPNVNADIARSVAEKLRKIIEATEVNNIDNFTASFGVARFNQSDTIDSFIKRADEALYKAKMKGRNTVETVE